MITYTTTQASRDALAIILYRRAKFKGTREAGPKQICIAFQCFAKEGVK